MADGHYAAHSQGLKRELKDALPADELRVLHEKSAARHFAVLAWQLLLLAACTTGLVLLESPWLWVPLAVVQGFTIFNFTVLLHEVVHHAVFRRRRPVAETVLRWLYAVPSGISGSQFTRWHLDHHAELGSPTEDPKRFHLSPRRNARWYKALYMTPALFVIYFRAAARETATYPEPLRRRIRLERAVTVLAQLGLLAALLAWDPGVALRVYVVPVFLVFPVAFTLNRLGQHYWVDPSDPGAWSTLVKSSPFWNVAFLNSNFHLEHHYFPGVPLYNLRRLHELLRPFHQRHGHREHGYGELLWNWFVLNKPPHSRWDETPAVPEAVAAR